MRFSQLFAPWLGVSPWTWRALFSLAILAGVLLRAAGEETNRAMVPIRFVDSATGFAVQPDVTEATPQDAGSPGKKLRRSGVSPEGRAALLLTKGRHTISARADGYQPMSGEFEVLADNPYQLEFQLDPLIAPREIQPGYVMTLHRWNETVFVGYVSDDKSGEPVADALVRTEPSGRETRTDARGYFQIYVPVQTRAEATNSPARLSFTKSGYRAEVRSHLELWSEGDWVYRIRLQRGEGENLLDERPLRRRSEYPVAILEESPFATSKESVTAPAAIETTLAAAAIGGGGIVTQQLASTTAHVRIPTNIRVLRQDGFTIDYISLQTYCQRSLPSEWIASWGSTGPGNSGTNCLLAGAVAIRTYAIGFVNSPDDVNYDICGTTSCQAYINTASDSRTTAAVNATANWVMFRPGATRIGFKLTEYSAENNQLGQACGDGFTAPNSGCLYDPVCAGESEFGHGRGMCQWGTARWASGRRMQNRVTSDSVTNGYPLQNWVWLCEHYYPDLVLAQGAPLVIGDDVKVLGVASLSIRECPGGNITNGTLCPQVATKVSGSVGTIIGGPTLVTVDGVGHTWWQVNWGDTNGWCVENYLERVSATPGAPLNLTATATSAYRINLSWTDNAANEIGTYIERAISASGPWISNAFVRAGVITFADTNVLPNTTYHYRVRTFNQTATSAYSNTNNATTPGFPPVLAAISNRIVFEQTLATFTNSATATDFVAALTDFNSAAAGVEVMFQEPTFSGSTSAFLSNAPNSSLTTTAVPAGGGSQALNVNLAFTNTAVNPWVRLTTSGTATLPNPVIDFTKRLRFRVWSDKLLGIAVGCRETTTATGTAIGSNGGGTGAIEWAGVTNQVGPQPQPTHWVTPSNWTTLEFNFPTEPIRSFVSGNGILSTASGLGTLEHLALVPGAGNTSYRIFLDDFEVFTPNALTYTLSNAPSGATIGASSGVFTWTPAEAQGPGVYNLGVQVTDSGTPPQSDFASFSITVNETNGTPSLTIPITQNIVETTAWSATNSASDSDLPTNTLTFGLVSGPSGLTLTPSSGVMTWTPAENQGPGSYPVTVRVFDNGTPSLSVTNTFTINVSETNATPSLTAIASQTVHAGTLVTQTASATDSDLPANVLSYSLLSPPLNASIASLSGVFSWQTSDADANTTNSITVQVTDDGVPLLSDTESFTVTVLPRPLIQQIELTSTNVVLTWSAISGTTYRVQAKTNLADTAWFDLVPDVTATNSTAARLEPLGEAARFYRVRVLPP